MKVYGFVPAKGTSERIENKNLLFLNGERLYEKAVKVLLSCQEIHKVFLDTESEEMFRHIDYLPVHFMRRDINLCNNKTDGHQMFMNEVDSYSDADIYVQLLCTSPFIKPETIDNAIRVLKNNPQYDSAILMRKDKYYFWNSDNTPQYNINHIPNSKDLPESIIESMGLYIHRKESALNTRRRYGNKPYFIWGSLEEQIDVNTPEDLVFAQTYARGIKQQEIERLRLIRHFATSSIFSDILDDLKSETGLEYGKVIDGFMQNRKGIKILGRANTLKLKKLKEGEDFRGIYEALHSYGSMVENDVICVENECKDFAYFGDLNARLAIRAGVCGTIIDGKTRDLTQTQFLDYPVFCKGYNAADVRKRATVDYVNKPIKLNDVVVTPGDLIFADDCSVVVIYQATKQKVIDRVVMVALNETNIVKDIFLNKDVKEILQKRGLF